MRDLPFGIAALFFSKNIVLGVTLECTMLTIRVNNKSRKE